MPLLAYFKTSSITAEGQDAKLIEKLQQDNECFLFLCDAPYPVIPHSIFNQNDIYSYYDTLVICDENCFNLAKKCPSQKKIFWVYNQLEDPSVLNDEQVIAVTESAELAQLYNIKQMRPEDVRFGEDGRAIFQSEDEPISSS